MNRFNIGHFANKTLEIVRGYSNDHSAVIRTGMMEIHVRKLSKSKRRDAKPSKKNEKLRLHFKISSPQPNSICCRNVAFNLNGELLWLNSLGLSIKLYRLCRRRRRCCSFPLSQHDIIDTNGLFIAVEGSARIKMSILI